MEGFMEYIVKMGLDATINVPSFIKIGATV
jgi:hypothetical protein